MWTNQGIEWMTENPQIHLTCNCMQSMIMNDFLMKILFIYENPNEWENKFKEKLRYNQQECYRTTWNTQYQLKRPWAIQVECKTSDACIFHHCVVYFMGGFSIESTTIYIYHFSCSTNEWLQTNVILRMKIISLFLCLKNGMESMIITVFQGNSTLVLYSKWFQLESFWRCLNFSSVFFSYIQSYSFWLLLTLLSVTLSLAIDLYTFS